MAEGLNRVSLMGALGADPELKHSGNGTAVLKIRMATTERIKKQDNWEDHTEWHSVVCFGKRAEALAKLLSKGSSVYVEGPLRTTSYEKDGVKRYRTEISADKILLSGGKRNGNGGGGGESSGDDTPF